MARILDAQRLAEGKHPAPAEAVAPAEAPKAVAAAEPEMISFIEVGGPVNGFHASADVLASPTRNARKAGVTSAPELARTELPHPVLTEPGPLFVAFQPWPAAPAAPFPELITFHQPNHPASEHYRTLLSRILSENTGAQPQALLFTGLTPGVGTTTVLLNLAVSAARDGKRRVAVLDLNVNRPAVAKRLGVTAGPWLDEVLAGRGGLEKALQATRVPGLTVLATEARAETAVRPSAEALRWILSWLRPRFDLILIDGPTWDNAPFLSATDAVFLLAPAEGPSAARLGQVAGEVARQGGLLRGILHTTSQY